MNQPFSVAQSYEALDTELGGVDREPPRKTRQGHGAKRGGACCARCAGLARGMEHEDELAAPAAPGWLNIVFQLYRAGRLGWRAGRWIDKQTGRRFGKTISQRGAEFLYRRLGRSRAAEDFFDNLPAPVKRWLNRL